VTDSAPLDLDPRRLRQLFDLRSSVYASRGGAFETDPYPAFHRLRETGPVHAGIVGPLVGFDDPDAMFQGLPFHDRLHFSAFDFATCDAVLHDEKAFGTSPGESSRDNLTYSSFLFMDDEPHLRYRQLVQTSFLPRRVGWWAERWIQPTVNALIRSFERNGRADLNIEFCAPIPLLTICGSFGMTVSQALDIRAAVTSEGRGTAKFFEILAPIVAARREQPQDDLISVLAQAELIDENGKRDVLSDAEIQSFAFILLAAGSGTTWKQMGITLLALLTHPKWLEAVRSDRALLRSAVEESVRWMPTDPMFSRFARYDTEVGGHQIPEGSVMHLCLGAANRDPSRWERPDEFDPSRPVKGHLGFGTGPHVCLGMHVARAEIQTGIGALLDRLPNLRLDPAAEAPRVIGMYERGPNAVPVVWDAA
jgi:cytochrome P450